MPIVKPSRLSLVCATIALVGASSVHAQTSAPDLGEVIIAPAVEDALSLKTGESVVTTDLKEAEPETEPTDSALEKLFETSPTASIAPETSSPAPAKEKAPAPAASVAPAKVPAPSSGMTQTMRGNITTVAAMLNAENQALTAGASRPSAASAPTPTSERVSAPSFARRSSGDPAVRVIAIYGMDLALKADVTLSGKSYHALAVGDKAGNWKVSDISGKCVTFRRGQKSKASLKGCWKDTPEPLFDPDSFGHGSSRYMRDGLRSGPPSMVLPPDMPRGDMPSPLSAGGY